MTHKLASLGSLIRMQGIELAGAPRTAAVMHPRRHSSHPAALDDAGALEREVSDRHLLQSGAFVGGAFVHPASGAAFEVLNPATGGRLARVSDCGGPETRAAIAAAAAAFGPWAARPARERAAALRRWHDAAWAARDDLARLITLECGKPLAEARSEVDTGLASIRWFAEEAPRVAGEVLSPPARATRFLVLRQPVGVVAAITPWNFPFSMITRKVAPALAAGCTVVCKPSELAPLTALALAALAARAGLPPGVLNMVPAAAGDAFRREVMASEAVRKVSFTGSTRVGKALYAAAAGTVKRLSLELGGNAPFVVFDDADVAKAARDVVASSCRNAGQTCICTNRVLVQARSRAGLGGQLRASCRAQCVLPAVDGFLTVFFFLCRRACTTSLWPPWWSAPPRSAWARAWRPAPPTARSSPRRRGGGWRPRWSRRWGRAPGWRWAGGAPRSTRGRASTAASSTSPPSCWVRRGLRR
jgi:hypothetical protein